MIKLNFAVESPWIFREYSQLSLMDQFLYQQFSVRQIKNQKFSTPHKWVNPLSSWHFPIYQTSVQASRLLKFFLYVSKLQSFS